jgi:hypothetical protein
MSGRERWAAWSALVAALSLAAALVFNGIQVHDGAVAQRQAQLTSELGMLMTLQALMSESVYGRTPYARQFQQLEAKRRRELTPSAYRATAKEAANMDYFAWLFNEGYLRIDGADQLWGPRMICEYKQAFAPAFQDPVRDLSNLVEFIRERGRELSRLTERC